MLTTQQRSLSSEFKMAGYRCQRFAATIGPGFHAELERDKIVASSNGISRDADLDANAPAVKDSRKRCCIPGESSFTTGTYLSSLLSLYAVSFALGMIVRYHPAAWADLMGRTTGDRMFPILRAAGRVVRRALSRIGRTRAGDSDLM